MDNEKKRIRRIGSLTFGVMMILIGINIFLQTITNVELFKFTLSLWPIVFILLGMETLYYSYKKEVELKYDILGIITIFVVLFLGMMFSIFNYGVNKVLYNKEIKSDIIYYLTNEEYNISFENKVNINNISDKNVIVKFLEDKEANQVSTRIIFEYNESYDGSILRVLKERDLLNSALERDYTNEKIIINDVPDFIKDIKIIVTAKDKSKIIYNGTVVE
ncbi:MAG: hypothetical protein K0R72_1148 [Clostridia bacterium]|jgi:hypothetical protein|nr:hypothetical protein [Clostridia bacterium]